MTKKNYFLCDSILLLLASINRKIAIKALTESKDISAIPECRKKTKKEHLEVVAHSRTRLSKEWRSASEFQAGLRMRHLLLTRRCSLGQYEIS